ncbi:MAG TPA: AsnC family transcriptional regulator [Actinomycetes bacterium]|jgi:DNA-binding Lrp family transcriptional regulator|nr:AsnC family transcriptional regulator [Actinomycetes bacterium]
MTPDRAKLDPLDRRIIAALQMDGRASWTDIADACGTSLATVARRAQQLLGEGVVRVAVIAPDINHAGPANLFILHIKSTAGEQVRVAEELLRRDDVRLVSLITGPFDLLAELVVRKDESLSARIVGELQSIEGVQACETDLLLHTYKVSHDWSRQLLTGETYVSGGSEPHECDPSHFNEMDRAILARLRGDGRASFRTVARDLGMNETTVRRRFETLRERGCVMVFTLVPAVSLGFESEIILQITVAPSRLDATARALATYRGVRYVGSTLGASSLMCEVILPTTRDVYQFVTQTLGDLDGVQGWTASMELVTCKRGFVETPWWRRALVDGRSAWLRPVSADPSPAARG